MRLRNWLLTGTSIGLMAVAPMPANAQSADLQSAIAAYQQAQSSGDTAAIDAARADLTEWCIVAGFANIDECIASASAPAAAPVPDNSAAEEEAARAAAEAEAQAAAEAAAQEQAEAEARAAAEAEAQAGAAAAAQEQAEAEARAAAEAEAQAAAEAAAQEQAEAEARAAQAAAAAAAQEQADAEARAAAEAEAQAAAEAAAQEQADADARAAAEAEAQAAAATAAQEQADAEARAAAETPAEQPAVEEPAAEQPAVEQPVVEQPAVEQPAVEQPAVEQPAVEQPAAEQPAVETPAAPAPEVDYSAQLAPLVADYETAVADLLGGANAEETNLRISAIYAQIRALCEALGNADVDACLASYNLSLPQVPALAQPEAQAEQPVEPPPAVVEETTSDGQTAEPLTELPAGVTVEQIAPLLDSAKDAPAEVAPPVESAAPSDAPVAPPVQPDVVVTTETLPQSDEAAQSEAVQTMAMETSADAATQDAGTQITAVDNTTVNQTVVNNYVTNIVNNVTTIENSGTTNIDNSTTINNVQQNNIEQNIQQNNVQQNYVQVVEAPVLQQSSTGDVIAQVILQVGAQLIVNSIGQDTDRFYNPQQDEIFYEELRNGRVREVITRPDGTQVITVRNRNGDVLRRSRVTPDGREYVLAYFDDRYDTDLSNWRDPGLDLPPLRLNIPARDYVLDARYADERELTTFFAQPPVEQVARLYSIDEVKRSARVRDSVRKLEVGNLTFDTGAATIGRDQVRSLSSVANAMLALLATNPNETFLIEGHSDAVGSDISNLRLSDARAATVARILSDFYGVPPENLATQGYGERYLKIRTEAAERENRRVTIRRITPLITVANR